VSLCLLLALLFNSRIGYVQAEPAEESLSSTDSSLADAEAAKSAEPSSDSAPAASSETVEVEVDDETSGTETAESVNVNLPLQSSGDVESTVFDLYIGDKFAGSMVASYTDDWFEVEDPQDAVSQLTDLKGDTDKIQELLTGRVDKKRTTPGVGTVYYDLSTFRIIIEPDAAFMKGRALEIGQRRIGEPDSGFSMQQTLGLASFAGTDADNTTAFTHRGIASYGDVFFRANGFLVESQPYQLNEATMGTIVDDYQARAGLLQMRGQSFVPSLRFAGLQFETAEFLFLDNDAARGSKFEIFVPSRSTVRFYRAGQLLSVQVLDFGLQEIDTSTFPQGSYDVDVLITDSSGRETREQRFFTKAGFLASRARPVFYLNGGAVRETTDINDTPLGQFGFKMRASEYFDVAAGVAATDENSIGNVSLSGLYDATRVGFEVAGSPNGDHATGGSLGLTLLGVSVSGQVAYASGEDTADASATPVPGAPSFVPQLSQAPVDLVIQTQKSNAVYVSRSFGPIDLRYNIQRNKIGDADTLYTRGPTVDWRIFSNYDHQTQLRYSDFATETSRIHSVQLFYHYRLSQFWGLDAQLLRRWQDLSDEMMALVGASYNSQLQTSGTGARIQGAEEARRLKQNNETRDSLTSSLLGNVTTDSVKLGTFIRDVHEIGGSGSSTFGANAESTFFVSNTGTVDLAHPAQNECVFVAEVEGNLLTEDDQFDVLVDGSKQGTVSIGERAIISLTPYRTYKINISAGEKSGLVDYDAKTYEVTLFPGNVAKRLWSIDKVFVLLGRLVDEDGRPIGRERVKGAKGYGFTEEDGSFQIEVTGRESLSIDSKRRKCSFDLKIEEIPEYLLDVGEVVCRSDSDDQLNADKPEDTTSAAPGSGDVEQP
jgi:hypothetical protein